MESNDNKDSDCSNPKPNKFISQGNSFRFIRGKMKGVRTEPDHQNIMVELSLRQREPRNEHEEELLKEISEIEVKGRSLEIPPEMQ
jgi:hypothetical protein